MPRYFLIFTTGALLTSSAVLAGVATTRPAAVLVPGTAQERAVAEPPAVKSVSLQFFGDIMLDRNVARNMGKRGLDYIFEHVASAPYATATPPNPLLRSAQDRLLARGGSERLWGDADLTIANLEGPFAPGRVKTSKSIAFRFDPKLARQLKQYGFDGFSLANNHAYDMGRRNAEFTRRTLVAAGLGYFGDELREGPEFTWYWGETSPNPSFAKEGRREPSPPQRGGQGGVSSTVAFIGVHNTYHAPDLKKVAAALSAARSQADYIIVNVHWGEEYKKISNKTQRDLAHWLIDHGATAVIGHHPHVVQEVEVYQGKPIFYSLGNFIFDQYFSADTQEGLSVGLILQNGGVKSAYLFPFFGVKSQIKIMRGDRREKFLSALFARSRLDADAVENNGKIMLESN